MTWKVGLSQAVRPVLLVGLTLVTNAWAETVSGPLDPAQACAAADSRLERLGCYDALFQRESEAPATADPRSTLWHATHAQEAERSDDDTAWLVREAGNAAETSVPAPGGT